MVSFKGWNVNHLTRNNYEFASRGSTKKVKIVNSISQRPNLEMEYSSPVYVSPPGPWNISSPSIDLSVKLSVARELTRTTQKLRTVDVYPQGFSFLPHRAPSTGTG